MRLLTWNCQGGFRKKAGLIAAFKPDLAVIQECEHPDKLLWKDVPRPASLTWFATQTAKGLGVFSWTDTVFAPMDVFDPSIEICAPLQIQAPVPFQLLAIWSKSHRRSSLSYSAQVYQALSVYRPLIAQADTVVMGDFNSSAARKTSRIGNHQTLTTLLADLWLFSAYHTFSGQQQGAESHGTYFHGRQRQLPAHIDFVYLPVRWRRCLKRVQVGDPAQWLQYSDHCPLIVDVDLEKLSPKA